MRIQSQTLVYPDLKRAPTVESGRGMPKVDALGFTTLAKSFIAFVALFLHVSSVDAEN